MLTLVVPTARCGTPEAKCQNALSSQRVIYGAIPLSHDANDIEGTSQRLANSRRCAGRATMAT